MREPHIVQPATMLFLRIIYYEDFFFPGLFLEDFVINHAKNNPCRKDVVWLSEKGSPLSFEALLSTSVRFIL